MYADRKKYLKELEAIRNSKVILFVTGDRPGWETVIAQDSYDIFVDHLDPIGKTEKITVVLYSRGGHTLAAWSIINLIRQFCDSWEVIVPHKALSAATLMCLGSDRIVMTKQASLGPIDPSVNNPLNPAIPGGAADARMPVSVEEVKGFIDMAREELATSSSDALTPVFLRLTEHVHPLVLGQIFRTRSQIKFLAQKLLSNHMVDADEMENVISFLCSESGSHDYTINRLEAKNDLKLNVESPDDKLYQLIKSIYDDFRDELEINVPYDQQQLLSLANPYDYDFHRCLIESVGGGCHCFLSKGALLYDATTQELSDTRSFEGWEKVA